MGMADSAASERDDATHMKGRSEAEQTTSRRDEAESLDRALRDRIRREYFARAGEVGAAYGITADDILRHVERANLAATPGPARALSYIEDLVLAAACVRGHPRAWAEAWSKYEGVLLRAARMRLDEADAIVFVRRYWIDLHAATTGCVPGFPTIADFVGVRPLRIWLTDRLLGRIELAIRASLAAASSSAILAGIPASLLAAVRNSRSSNRDRRVRADRLPPARALRLVD
jgi:hypothetical protein